MITSPTMSAVRRIMLMLGVSGLLVHPALSQDAPMATEIVGMDPDLAADLVAVLGDTAGRVSAYPLKLVTDRTQKRVYLPETSGMVSVYDTDSLRCLGKLPLHSARCLDLAIVGEGQNLVSIAMDGKARLWDITGPQPIRLDEFPIIDKQEWVKMSCSRDADLFAFRSGKEIRIVEIRDGKFIQRSRLTQENFDTAFGIPHDFAVSPDGSWLATCELHSTKTLISMAMGEGKVTYGYHDATLALWNLADAKPERGITLDRKVVSNLMFSSDSKHLYGDDPYFLADGKTHVWKIEKDELSAGEDLDSAFGLSHSNSLTFSRDGRLIGRISGEEMTIKVSKENGIVSRGMISPRQRIASATFVGDDVLMFAGNLLRRWDWRGGEYQQRKLPAGHHSSVRGLFFNAKSNSLVSTSADASLQWDLKNVAKGQAVPYESLWLGSASYLCSKVDQSEFLVLQHINDEQFVTGVGVTRAGKLVEKFSIEMTTGNNFEQCWCMAMHPKERIVATGHHNYSIFLWNIDGGQPSILATWKAHGGHVCDLAFSPDGSQLVSAGWDKAVNLWKIDLDEIRQGHVPKGQLVGNDNNIVRTVAWSKDGKHLAAGGEAGQILLWKIEEDQVSKPQSLVHSGDDPNSSSVQDPRTICDLEFSRSGAHLLSADGKGRASLWSIDTTKPLKKWKCPGWIDAARFSPDESMIAIANNDGSIYLVRSPKFNTD